MHHRSQSPSVSNLHQSTASFSLLNQSLSTNAFTGIIPSATDEVLKLRKELRSKEAEFNKEKAILQQKVELLELQLKDSIEREESQRRMHETMINCLKKDDPRSSNIKDSQTAAEKAAMQEIQDLRDQRKKLLEDQDSKEREWKSNLQSKDQMIKELQAQLEKMLTDKRALQYTLESELKDQQAKIQILTSERDQIAEKMELKNQTKIKSLQMEIEKLRLEHQREMEKVKNDYDGNLKEIRYCHEQEKMNMEHRVERSTHELKSLLSHTQLKQQSDSQVNQRREELEKQIEFLHREVEGIKVDYESQLELLKLEKEQAEQQCRKYQKQLEKLKSAPKPIKIDLVSAEQEVNLQKQVKNLQNEAAQLSAENEKMSEQIKKLRRELLENQDFIEKIESNERKLRNMLKEKESDLDSEKIDLKKMLNQEKKKSIEAIETSNRLRDSFEKSKNKHLQDLLEKDEKIIKLTRELRECEKKFSESSRQNRNQSPFNADTTNAHMRTISYSPINHTQLQTNFAFPNHNIQISPRGSTQQFAPQQIEKLSMKQITQLEFTLLKTCQRMADSASRMECSHCFLTFETSDFYDHLIQEHPQANKQLSSTHQSSISMGGTYQSNKGQQSLTHLNKRQYVEDCNTNTSISPKSALLSRNNPKIVQNSRSFTCLLNEIEEEEKHSGDSQRKGKDEEKKRDFKRSHHSSKQGKPSDKDYKRSRNTNNSTVLIGNTNSTIGGQGNTIQSVLRTQKQPTTHKSRAPIEQKIMNQTSVSPAPQAVTVNTACRTEIQNLKKQNKKLSTQLLNQESKIQDISRDCSQLKKKAMKEESRQSSKLTNEIKDLLEKLVSYQGAPSGSISSRKESGAFTSRQTNTNQMNTESIVQMRSSTSMSSLSGVSQAKGKKHRKSKSPIESQVLTARNHASNKENQSLQQKPSQQKQHKVPQLKYMPQPSQQEENHNISSGEDNRNPINTQHFHQNSCSSKCPTERRFIGHHDSGSNCTNSPSRYQNYFEVLQSIPSSIQDNGKQPRYSPTQESTQKMNSYRLYQVGQCKGQASGQSRNNSNLPMIYNSKYTNNSSQHNLVLYDSNNTDMFKSKMMNKNSCGKVGSNQVYQVSNMRKLEFDEQCCIEDDPKMTSSSCPSLNGFDEDSSHQVLTEDPFVTGRFCQNEKQFVFKNSKNNTLKNMNFNQ